MARPRRRIAPLALALGATLGLAGCHHRADPPSKAKRAADLMVAVAQGQLTIIEGIQTRLAPKPPCADAGRSVVSFVDAQGKAMRPRTTALGGLLAHLGPEDVTRAVKLARPEMGQILSKSQALAGPEGKLARAFSRRCPDASKAILAANARVLAMIHDVEQQVSKQ